MRVYRYDKLNQFKKFVQKYIFNRVYSLREFHYFTIKLRMKRHDLRYQLECEKRKKGVAALTGHVVDVVQVHSQSIM